MGQNVTIIISSKCVFVIYMFLSVVKLSMFRCRAMDDAHIQRQHTASNIFNGEKHDLYCVAIKLKTRSIRGIWNLFYGFCACKRNNTIRKMKKIKMCVCMCVGYA